MASGIGRTPAEILRALEAGSKRVSQLATSLSARITSFEDWLNSLPGRVETQLWLPAPPTPGEDNRYVGLWLHRAGKRWVISHSTYRDGIDDPDDVEWQSIVDASVQAKVAAVRSFPKLLEQILKAQQELAADIERAHHEFDQFAEAIGATAIARGVA